MQYFYDLTQSLSGSEQESSNLPQRPSKKPAWRGG